MKSYVLVSVADWKQKKTFNATVLLTVCIVVRQATHHPRRLLHATGDTLGSENQGAFGCKLDPSACLTVLRAPLDGDGACFATFLDVCLIVFCALFAAFLALLVALLAAPFMTVREPLLACTHAMPHRRDRSCPKSGEACVNHDENKYS